MPEFLLKLSVTRDSFFSPGAQRNAEIEPGTLAGLAPSSFALGNSLFMRLARRFCRTEPVQPRFAWGDVVELFSTGWWAQCPLAPCDA